MAILKRSYEEAKRLLSENRKALDKIAEFLIEKETITGKEFMEIFRKVQAEEKQTEEGQDQESQTEEKLADMVETPVQPEPAPQENEKC